MTNQFIGWTTITLIGGLLACGGSQAEPETPAPPAPEEPSAAPPMETWDESASHESKAAFMQAKVVPAMSAVFQTASAEKYADFSCATCHGPDNQDPHDYLPRLKAVDGNITAFADSPDVAQFMAGQVVPAMASALGVEPFNMETHEGFGCGGCHAVDM